MTSGQEERAAVRIVLDKIEMSRKDRLGEKRKDCHTDKTGKENVYKHYKYFKANRQTQGQT